MTGITIVKSLDRKLEDLLARPGRSKEFILADAKDADMAFGITAPGLRLPRNPERVPKSEIPWKSLEEYREQIRAVIHQGVVDIMLLSASNLEQLAMREKLFAQSPVTPAARANDTSDIWVIRGSSYSQVPSRPFRSATIDHIQCGEIDCEHGQRALGADLGLYSVTFNNRLEEDHRTLEAFKEFREEAERKSFRYFLEVFPPNAPHGLESADLGSFINDHIIRSLAGVTRRGRPLFLKIPYLGPRAMEELAAYDPSLLVGILGGSAGTTYDAFKMIAEARKYGARVALYGRKINSSEHPLAFIEMLRAIVEESISPEEAVRAYHGILANLGIAPFRSLEKDMELTQSALSYSGGSTRSAGSGGPGAAAGESTSRSSADSNSNNLPPQVALQLERLRQRLGK